MEVGSVADWASAFATTFAAVVALHLGLRDQLKAKRRSEARESIRSSAQNKALALVQLDKGINTSLARTDVIHADDEIDLAQYVEWSDNLGFARRRWARFCLSYIYGRKALQETKVIRANKEGEWFRKTLWTTRLVADGGYLPPARESRLHKTLIGDPVDRTKLHRLIWAFTALAAV